MNMKLNMKVLAILGISIIFLAILVQDTEAQDTSCLDQLAPCLSYLNGTRHPPDSCCNSLKNVIESKPECLCTLISNQGTRQAEQAGVNINEAQQLPGRCGQHVNPLACLSGAPNSRNSDQESASVMVLPSEGIKVVVALLMTAQILWALNSL